MATNAWKTEINVIRTKDEMNLVEIPFGPITAGNAQSFGVEHEVYDPILKRRVTRATVITGSQLFGLPRPIDDQVLVGMQALTYEAGYTSRKVCFSRYHLCRLLGWSPDGRSYRRLEESFDRIAGTTLRFKDAWYDKGEREWKSKTFHLIEEVDLCSQERLQRARIATGRASHKLCSFVWNETVWKSFEDGFIKSLDMRMYRTIARGRRREVPLRLFRILDKRFHRCSQATFDLRGLCVGTLGLSPNYGPSQMRRILARAADWLVECGYLRGYREAECGSSGLRRCSSGRSLDIIFYKQPKRSRPQATPVRKPQPVPQLRRDTPVERDSLRMWLERQSDEELLRWEDLALGERFGSLLEQNVVRGERARVPAVRYGGRIRDSVLCLRLRRDSAKSARQVHGCENSWALETVD
jgi:replication initiator protein A